MRIIRYQNDGDEPKYGWILEDKVGEIQGNIFGEYRRREARTPIAELKLLPPCTPSKIICVGRNYVEHAKELGNEIPKTPLLFFKPPSAVIANGEQIFLPPQSAQVEHEAELVVVIGQRAKNVIAETAKEYIFGYTIGNDITARDLQKTDGQWTRAKGFDTFCPFGPWIDTDFDASDAVVTCRVNGQMRQMASTRDMLFSVSTLIAYISSIMTLEPGDLIFTGTPAGVGTLKIGDVVDVEIEGLGKLSNPVKA
ncbi:MAG: fumarylacetoacetate hydrolase family protein [Anaerolineales bacterium]|nr:fumarylacetoacetate hydrolase family protein [Anaerolineales bacterium]MCZ2122259.1 fumarylacetoacetate hydrolase family protein [Anaerolineales bacterium]